MLKKSFDEKMSVAMARGTVVLDENLWHLVQALKDKNMHVIMPDAKMNDQKIKHDLLSNRILITENSKDFVRDASVYDYGIIATEKLSSKDVDNVVQKIQDALIDHSLWSKRHGFIVYLKDNGTSDYRELTT